MTKTFYISTVHRIHSNYYCNRSFLEEINSLLSQVKISIVKIRINIKNRRILLGNSKREEFTKSADCKENQEEKFC